MSEFRYTDRAHDRLPVRMIARYRESGSNKQCEVDVIDVSSGGCRLISDARLHPGTRVWIAFHGLSALETIIIWRKDREHGAKFHAPLHPAVLEHIAARGRW